MKVKTIISKQFLSAILILALVLTMTPIYSSAKAKKVKLSKTKVTLYVGKTTTLKLKNNKKKIKWSSNKKKVATVSKKGVVKAKKKGTAKITAKVGKKKYTCKVTVKQKAIIQKKVTPTPFTTPKPTAIPKPTPTVIPTPTPKIPMESFTLDKSEVTVEFGKPAYINIIPTPSDANIIPEIIWERSNEKLVYVYTTDNPWQIKFCTYGGIAGTATVTIKIGATSATCKVIVPDAEGEFLISEDGKTLIKCLNDDKATILNIPDTITTLGEGCFCDCDIIRELIIPSSVVTIESRALPCYLSSIYIPSSVTCINCYLNKETTVYGEAGSYAEQWANENGYTFVATETPGIPETTETTE